MPSRDEQRIWEDLRSFPDQKLSWERKQVMLENIREERRKISKQQKRAKYVWVANGLVACAAVFFVIWMKPFSTPVEKSASHASIDPAYVEAAQKAIKSAGINKEILFDEFEKDGDYDIIRKADREAIVTFYPNTTKVRTILVECAVNELPTSYQKYVDTAQKAFKEANQQVVFQQARFFKSDEGTDLSFYLENQQYVSVDVNTNRVTDYSLDYKLDDVDKKYVYQAQKALMLLTGKQSFSFSHANKRSGKVEEVWTLKNENERYTVRIGAKSSRIYKVDHVTDRYKINSKEEAISVTKPLIASIFGIDIAGYKADGGKDWGGYVLTSEGKPVIRVIIHDLHIGDISGIYVEWDE
ncbi:hypothetical protein EDM54_00755 [Brevibacillus borstelensis]|jgi:hypothetical protein|nr:hypothetical protein EDM54_00755 [Brevibacillus borstelensis]